MARPLATGGLAARIQVGAAMAWSCRGAVVGASERRSAEAVMPRTGLADPQLGLAAVAGRRRLATMSKGTTYFLVSLPSSIVPSHHPQEALEALDAAVAPDYGTARPFAIPAFKIGTLDALVQQADDLAKLEAACDGVVGRVGDALRGILGDDDKAAQQKTVNDSTCAPPASPPGADVAKSPSTSIWPRSSGTRSSTAPTSPSPTWSTRCKRCAFRPPSGGADRCRKSPASTTTSRPSTTSTTKSRPIWLPRSGGRRRPVCPVRRRTADAASGNLSTRSLASVVSPTSLIQDSDYLDTHLIAVPKQMLKDFYKSYEALAPMVVPRSAAQIAADDEFALVSVVTFKKHSAEFLHKAREKRWTPREFKYREGGKEEEAREVDQLRQDERKLWGEALRLGRTYYSESAMIWIHVLALRVFVETVLRYGLPLDFVCGLIQVRQPSEGREC